MSTEGQDGGQVDHPDDADSAPAGTGHGSHADHADHADLRERLGQAGRRFSDASVMFHTALGERLGLGATDLKMLGLLQQHGPLTAGELASHSGLAPASVTGVLDRLQRRSYVHRRRDERDGRRVVVEPAPGLLTEVVSLFAGFDRRLDNLLERYDERELALVAGFLDAAARAQTAAAAELSEAPAAGDGRNP